ncbi:polysaccharide biosynthesis tyrosine autokinase [Rhizobium daejeonense]|uniref:Polysaccharide biosynthesis tyrosine autokinase n=1 Tax=Rhizobium daejeonense TaxID=240521 RepID=A0A6M1SDF6_9HYPH|nr:exopolysaccharide transport family protein [Rhizobium daejeonense]NGO66278.1 polysaccharide biosynthesis tyrosine autokinase [Rhizobium daejeonense]
MGFHEFGNIETISHLEKKDASKKEYISFRDIFNFLKKNMIVIAACTATGAILGGIYVLNSKSTYMATTRLVMDPEQGRIVSQDAATGTVIIEAAEIASQVEIVKSEAIAQAVIHKLGLTEDPEIINSRSLKSVLKGFVTSATGIFTGGGDEDEEPPTEEELMRRTMGGFLSRVTVRRVGQSYVLEIGYTSGDPEKAARTANALAEAYIRNGLNDRADAAKQGASWLESRLIEVGRKAREAALAAEEYRNKHDITAMANSSTLDQQQLAEVSSQMLAARAATAAESAKLTTLTRLIEGKSADGNMDEIANNPQIQKLRDDIRLAETRLENLKSRYNDGNPAIIAARDEIARMKAAIDGELRQIEAIYRSNVETARTREQLAEEQFTNATAKGADKNIARVELSEMESRANTYRRLYESILQQYVGTMQTQSFPLGKARIVTAATAPFGRIWPKPTIILPFATVLGFAGGLMASILRSGLDRRAGSGERLQRELGITSLGSIPVYRPQLDGGNVGKPLPTTMLPLRSVLDMPYSRFSEALRSVKNSLDSIIPANGSIVIGVTSVGPGEGKTTIATNLAQLYQNEGQSVLLVDADFIGSRLSRLAASAAKDVAVKPVELSFLGEQPVALQPSRSSAGKGIHGSVVSELERNDVSGEQEAGDTNPVPLVTVEQAKLAAAANQRYGHLTTVKEAIVKMRRRYKVIIVDMSGFEDSADTRTICTYVDGIILVLGNSNKMTIERLADALSAFGKSRIALLGVISNRSDARRRQAAG